MVNILENIFCVFDIWEMFCFPSKLPRAFRVSWMDRGTGRDTRLHWSSLWLQSRTWGPAQPWVSEWARPQGHLWQLSRHCRGTLSPAPARKAKPAWKNQDNHSKLWNSAPACSYLRSWGISMYFPKSVFYQKKFTQYFGLKLQEIINKFLTSKRFFFKS